MLTVIPMILQLIQLGLPVAQELLAAGQTEVGLVSAVSPPTAEQQAAIDAAMDAAEAALQAAQPVPGDTPSAV